MPPKRGRGAKSFFNQRQQPGADKPLIYKPRPRYPSTPIPKLIPLRRTESSRVAHFRALRKAHRDGPLYTVLDASMRIAKPSDLPGMRTFGYSTAQAAANAAVNAKELDPFEALPTFSQKYKKPRRPVPKLDGGDYIKSYFPLELHQFIDPNAAAAAAAAKQQNGGIARSRLKMTAAEEEEMLEDEEAIMEEEDDDFEDDEDDDDDYNAENYFSDGKSDAGGDEGGGGDDY